MADRMKPDESRLPLDGTRVLARLTAAGWQGPPPVLLGSVGSTNAEAETLAAAGAPEGTVVVAEEQTAGRGRIGRTWVSPAGAGLWLSYVVRPGAVPVERWSWLPLLAGVAAHDAIRTATGVPVGLKWPNDIVVVAAMCGGDGNGTRKLGGILSEVVGDAVVVGIGVNVALGSLELPTPQATSVYAEGGDIDRGGLLAALLPQIAHRLEQWRTDMEPLRADYRDACLTIGRRVDIERPGGQPLQGVVTGVDDNGHLVVDDDGAVRTVTVGDVVHATV